MRHLVSTWLLLSLSVPFRTLAEENPEAIVPKSSAARSQEKADAGTRRGPRRPITPEQRETALKEDEARKRDEEVARKKAAEEERVKAAAEEEARKKAELEARARAEKARVEAEADERLRKAEAEKKRLAEEEKQLQAERKKLDAEAKKHQADEKKRLAAEAKRLQEEERRLQEEKRQQEALARKQAEVAAREAAVAKQREELERKKKELEEARAKLEEERRRRLGEDAQSEQIAEYERQHRLVEMAERKRRANQAELDKARTAAPAQVSKRSPLTPAAGTPNSSTTPAVATGGGRSGLVPANTIGEAQTDPWFRARAPGENARVKVLSVASAYPFFPVRESGCSAGTHFVHAELLDGFDGLSAGTPVVLRLEDAAFGSGGAGATFAFSGLRRAGKAKDGTYVYCGKGTAVPVHR